MVSKKVYNCIGEIKMVKVNIEGKEAEAIIKLIDDASVPAETGYALTLVKYKLMKAFKDEADKEAKKGK